MMPLFRYLLIGLLLATGLHASRDLDDVINARRMLPLGLWSKSVVIQNAQPHAKYPRKTFGLVFEFGGVLWFYTPYDGTQSLSTHYGVAERDKGRLDELLRLVHPGFCSHTEPVDKVRRKGGATPEPRNSCFLQSVKALVETCAGRAKILEAALLSYHFKDPLRSGHTVFSYRTDQGCFVHDSARSGKPVAVAVKTLSDPKAIATALNPLSDISSARFFKVEEGLLRRRLDYAGTARSDGKTVPMEQAKKESGMDRT